VDDAFPPNGGSEKGNPAKSASALPAGGCSLDM
jgi:hypothetical protein